MVFSIQKNYYFLQSALQVKEFWMLCFEPAFFNRFLILLMLFVLTSANRNVRLF